MATPRSERPRFFEGQYIGAADLMAAVDYGRELVREGMLAGQTWGIAIGLELVETEAAGGGTDYFVLPGLAYDGYGRALVLLSPLQVPAAKFANLATGNHKVWLRYAEAGLQGLRAGWETCGDTDSFARVRESVEIEVGAFAGVRDRQGGVSVAGLAVEDARLALRAVDADAPMFCDGSVPHQTYPDDLARWLVPVGLAAWTMGAPGSLGARSDAAKSGSRTFRRYVGHVGESLYAADGVLRLRDRFDQFKAGDSADDLCAKHVIKDDDLEQAIDRDNSATKLDRLVGRELVWVEGHMRVTGDARLFGTRLELRDTAGTERTDVPLYLRRGAAVNAGGGEDLEVAIGTKADGKSRLLVGVAEPEKPFVPKLQLKNDGRLAVGQTIPADVLAHTILATTDGDTSVAIAAAEKKVSLLQFAMGDALEPVAHVAFDHATGTLRLGSGTDLANFIYVSALGKVGLKNDSPDGLDADANDLVIQSPANSGMTILSDAGQAGRINFADGVAGAARHDGFIRYDHGNGHMELGTNEQARVFIDAAGNIGVGTSTPGARVHIAAPPGGQTLRLDVGAIRADNGGVASLLNLQSAGGGVLVGGGLAADQQVYLSPAGRIGVGTQVPAAAIHVRSQFPELMLETSAAGAVPGISMMDGGALRSRMFWSPTDTRTHINNKNANSLTLDGNRVGVNQTAPDNVLHVTGAVDGSAFDTASHLVFFDNTAGGSADVLALRVGTSPGSGNNFITFFGTGGACGMIEGNGGNTVTYSTSGADFAEFLPRVGGDAIGPGRIVGVHGGRISLVTVGADSLLVTTDRAAFVGNAPPGDASHGERVAFMGQVAVWIENAVVAGDYIVPSGRDDGVGRAVRPGALTLADAAFIVGRAWESAGPGRVNVAIGVQSAPAVGMAAAMLAQGELVAQLQAEIAALRARMDG